MKFNLVCVQLEKNWACVQQGNTLHTFLGFDVFLYQKNHQVLGGNTKILHVCSVTLCYTNALTYNRVPLFLWFVREQVTRTPAAEVLGGDMQVGR